MHCSRMLTIRVPRNSAARSLAATLSHLSGVSCSKSGRKFSPLSIINELERTLTPNTGAWKLEARVRMARKTKSLSICGGREEVDEVAERRSRVRKVSLRT